METIRGIIRLSTAILIGLSCVTVVGARDLIPERRIENLTADDGSVQKCLIFRTVSGVNYRIESSADLKTWENETEVYGLGHEFAVPFHQVAAAPPSTPGNPLPISSWNVASLKAEPSSTASGTVLSWRSLDDGSSVIYRIAGQLHPDWSLSLLFSKRYDTHYFLIWHPNGSAPAPAENPILGVKDAAMIAKLEANFQDMNDTVAAAAAVARSAPPSAPPVSGERKYYRINADWSVDTDGDGNQDWMEFEVAADVSHPDHSLGSTFNADADGDGITDGKEADFDRDGISNAEDASKGDQLINWTSQPTPRYALFELHGTPDPSTPEGKPFHVTDRGGVPFRKGVWKTNVYHELILDSNEVRGARVVAMGESGRILGIGGVDNNEDENVDTSVMVYWDNTDGEPEVIEEDGGATGKVYATPRYDMSYGLLDTGTLLDSNDNFFAGKQSLVWTEPQGDPPVPPKPFELLEITNALWTLPGASGTEPTHAGAPPHATNLIDTATFWGNDYTQGEHGKLVLTGGGGNIIADSTASRVAVTPSGGFFAGSSSFGGTALMTANNGWQSAADLSRAIDISSSGWAILNNQQIWMNGRSLPFADVAPGLPPSWEGSIDFLDSSPRGNILARCGNNTGSGTRIYGMAVPFHIEDNQIATGVDSVSITSTLPGNAVAKKHWIMAPAGGSNACTLCSTANPASPLDLSAGTISFNPSTASAQRQALVVSAPPGGTTYDTQMQIRLGGQLSLSSPIGVKVMKRRTVRVTIHKIATTRQAPDGSSVRDVPNYIPNKGTLEGYLDSIYLPQLNVNFEIVMNPAQDGECLDVNWDTGSGADYGVPGSDKVMPGDGKLQGTSGRLSYEQNNIYAAVNDEGSEIDVYLIGGARLVVVTRYEGSLISSGLAYGMANRGDENAVFIDGDAGILDEVIGRDPMAEQQHTIAHEIGHVLMGMGHPDQKAGVAPLPGTLHEERLMVSGGGIRRPNFGRLIVKGEWDEAEDWLESNVAATP